MTLSPLAQTLLLPLWGRARYGRLVPEAHDPVAAELLARVGADEATLERGLGPYGVLAFGRRAAWIDARAREWLREHPGGLLLNLGAGLDTLLQRVDDGACRGVSVDLPEVIALRRALLGTHPQESLVEARLEAPEALVGLGREPALVVLAGVSMYLDRENLHALFTGLSERLAPGSLLLMDVYRPSTARITNALAKLTGVSEAPVFGDAWDAEALSRVAPRLWLRASLEPFEGALPGGVGLGTRLQVLLARAVRFTAHREWEAR